MTGFYQRIRQFSMVSFTAKERFMGFHSGSFIALIAKLDCCEIICSSQTLQLITPMRKLDPKKVFQHLVPGPVLFTL